MMATRRPTQSISSFNEEKAVWQNALAVGYARIECGTRNRAIYVVQRLNQYRVAKRRQAYHVHKSNPLGLQGSMRRKFWQMEVDQMLAQWTMEDEYTIRRPNDGSCIYIEKRERLIQAMYDKDGKEIKVDVERGAPDLMSHRMDDFDRVLYDENSNKLIGDDDWPAVGEDPDQPLGLDIADEK